MLSDDPCSFVAAHSSWIQTFTAAAVPLWTSYTQTAKGYLRTCDGGWKYPVIGIKPWGIIYNTDKVKTAPTWQDVLALGKQGSFGDPRVADAYYNFWYLMLQTYGASFLQNVASQKKSPFKRDNYPISLMLIGSLADPMV